MNSSRVMLPTPYQHFIYVSRYSRWLEEENRRETWEETVERYFEFFDSHLLKNQKYTVPSKVRKELKDAILNLEIMPSMRALMTAGPALERSNIAGYNCGYVAINNIRALPEIMMVLLSGTGVGYSVERQYIEKLPTIAEEFHTTGTTIVVEDSKGGWAKAYRELLSLLIVGQIPKWDLSKVRPTGARLKTFGGRASGPGPLDELFKFTSDTFKKAAGRKLSSIECHDVVCKIASSIICGGVRRSALISLSNLTDEKMRDAKSGAWWVENPQRALANNSVAYKEKPEIGVFMDEWVSLYKSKSGERGIFNREAAKKTIMKLGDRRDPDYEWGCNPCVSKDMMISTNLGLQSVESLIGVPFVALCDGEYESTGFVKTGTKQLFKVTTEAGHQLRATDNHKLLMSTGNWQELGNCIVGEELTIGNTQNKSHTKIVSIVEDGIEDVYDCAVPKIERFVCNGLVVHNCSEILLRDRELCNLSSVMIRPEDTKETLSRKIRLATILGTWQASLTHFPFLSSEWKKNCEEEALLGVSLTGIMDNPLMCSKDHVALGQLLEDLKKVAIETNVEWAKRIGINRSAAITCIKPEGTSSALTDTASGIHARHSEYYVRTVRADNKDPLAHMMISLGFPNEPCVMSPHNIIIFSFPHSAVGSICRKDMTAIEHLELVLTYQKSWTEHKPSVTISVKDSEWLAVGSWVFEHFDEMSGVSFLPFSDHSYQQAPYQECTKEIYDSLLAKMPVDVDWSILRQFEKEDTTKSTQTLSCTANSCEVVDLI